MFFHFSGTVTQKVEVFNLAVRGQQIPGYLLVCCIEEKKKKNGNKWKTKIVPEFLKILGQMLSEMASPGIDL